MRIKLTEGWKHQIEQELSAPFRTAIDEQSLIDFKKYATAIIEKCKTFFDPEEDDYVITELDELLGLFLDLSESSKEADWDHALSELYDFCDGYKIFIDL